MNSLLKHTAVLLRFLLVNALIWVSNFGFSQEPASYLLGEDQFKGVKIYDLIQDNKQHFWISTDEGLYKYDYKTYKHIDAKNAKTNALFQFVKANNGSIYCINLSNQIFRIKDGVCDLFYEIPESESNAKVIISISSKQNLIVASKSISFINPNGKLILKHSGNFGVISSIAPFPSGDIHFTTNTGSLLKFEKKKWKSTQLDDNPNTTRTFVKLNEDYQVFDAFSNEIYTYNKKTGLGKSTKINLVITNKIRYYNAGKHLWFSSNEKGVYCFSHKKKTLNHYFQNYFISDIFEDKEGNILLATFDHGIIVVPDIIVPGILPQYADGEVVSIYSDKDLGFVCGTDQGLVYNHLNKNYNTLIPSTAEKSTIEGIYGQDNFPFLIIGKNGIQAFDKRSRKLINIQDGSLKDVVFVNNNSFYAATNNGLFFIEYKGGSGFQSTEIKEISYRVYSLAYDKTNEVLYASTAKGLYYFQGAQRKLVRYQKQDVFASDFFEKDGIVWASTQNFGILKIVNGKVVGVIQPKVDGNLESINKFVINENYILASTTSGFYKFTNNGSVIDALHTSNSFGSRRVFDFTLNENKVWVSHFGGVQQLNLQYRTYIPKSSLLQISQVTINNKTEKGTKLYANGDNRISFTLTAPTLRNRNIQYTYKLAGYDEFWLAGSNQNGPITYNGLSSGDYIFMVKEEDSHGSMHLVKYHFTVESPFYTKAWFILLCIVLPIILGRQFYSSLKRTNSSISESHIRLENGQVDILNTLQELNSMIPLPVKALKQRYFKKDELEKIIQENFKAQLEDSTTVTVDWKLGNDKQLPLWILLPFIYNAFSFGFNGKVGEKLLRISIAETDQSWLVTIEDNIPRFTTNKTQRIETDKSLVENEKIKSYFELLSGITKEIRVNHHEKISGEQMLGATVAITIPKTNHELH